MTETASLQAVMQRCLHHYAEAHPLNARQWQVCRHVLDCRTAVLGGLELECDHCHAVVPQYHSCRDRHCPRCQRQATQDWCAQRRADLLPVNYYHLVFTLPHVLNPWFELHARVLYGLLFQTVWSTLQAFGADPKRLGGQLGMMAVLHTWGQNLGRHVHLHCLIPGGALSPTGQWIAARSTSLFPVRALSVGFRGRFVSGLRQAIDAGRCERLIDQARTDATLDTLMATPWVVYAKRCLSQPATVVDYLGRYTHRTALSDGRLQRIEGDRVTLRYKDYRTGGQNKTMVLQCEELLRRYLLHVLPKGLMRIRHFGFLANCYRAKRLRLIRTALDQAPAILDTPLKAEAPWPFGDGYPCPVCCQGRLKVTAQRPRPRREGG